MSVEFDTPANRIVSQFAPKNKFTIDTSLPDLSFLRQLSIQGRLWYEQASAVATNANLLTRTTPDGSTDFIYRLIFAVAGSGAFIITLSNDNQTRFSGQLAAGGHQFEIFDSLAGNGTKTINIAATEVGIASVNITMFGWTENTSRIRDVIT